MNKLIILSGLNRLSKIFFNMRRFEAADIDNVLDHPTHFLLGPKLSRWTLYMQCFIPKLTNNIGWSRKEGAVYVNVWLELLHIVICRKQHHWKNAGEESIFSVMHFTIRAQMDVVVLTFFLLETVLVSGTSSLISFEENPF